VLAFVGEGAALGQAGVADRLVVRGRGDLQRALQGGRRALCYCAGNCAGHYLTFEPDGQVAACDKYVGLPEFTFGRLQSGALPELLARSPKLAAARAEIDRARSDVAQCRWFGICQGGCPHDRRLTQTLGTAAAGCCGYAPLLDHIAAHQSGSTAMIATERRPQ